MVIDGDVMHYAFKCVLYGEHLCSSNARVVKANKQGL